MVGSGFDIIPARGLPGGAGRCAPFVLGLALAVAITLVVAAQLLVTA